jgi:hypothetical protein
MRLRPTLTIVLLLSSAPLALVAKGKQKEPFPPAILAAQTVAVIIDPESGELPSDPFANQTARKDVETALMNWHRFEVRTAGQPADLIIVVRRGKPGVANGTIRDPRENNRTGTINPLENGIQIGAQQGQPIGSSPAGAPTRGTDPSMQAESGPSEDSFLVYNGTNKNPLNFPPLWRNLGPEALRSHSVPAAEEFRKAVTAAEKAAAEKKP